MQQGDAGMKPAAWLANKAGILQLPSERKIYLFHWTELWAAGVCAVAPCEPSPSLPSAGFSHSPSLSNAALAHLFPHSQPQSLTHQRHDWLSIANSSLVLQDRDYVGVYMLYCAEDRLHEHNENLNEKSWTDPTSGFACFIPTTVFCKFPDIGFHYFPYTMNIKHWLLKPSQWSSSSFFCQRYITVAW